MYEKIREINKMILWSGAFEDLSGYSVAARDYVKAFYDAGVDIKCHYRSFDHRGSNRAQIDKDNLALCDKLRTEKVSHRDFNFICHSTPNVSFTVPARKTILYTVWETNMIPSMFKPYISPFDFLLTPSEFSRQAFINTCPSLDIKVLPHIIHNFSKSSFPVSSKLEDTLKDKFVFLWNGEWMTGKGYDIVLKAFTKVFKGNKDVVLLFKTYNLGTVNYKNDVTNYIKKIKTTEYPWVIPLVGDLDREHTLGLYQLANVFLNTSRREGWSLTSSEALGFGLPVIAPDKGGHREFLNKDNSLLYKSYWDKVQNLEAQRVLYQGQSWIESDIDNLSEMLKHVYQNYSEIKTNFNKGIKKTIKQFSPQNITTKFLEYME